MIVVSTGLLAPPGEMTPAHGARSNPLFTLWGLALMGSAMGLWLRWMLARPVAVLGALLPAFLLLNPWTLLILGPAMVTALSGLVVPFLLLRRDVTAWLRGDDVGRKTTSEGQAHP